MQANASPPTSPRRPPKRRALKRTLLFIIILVLVATLGYAGYVLYKINAAIDRAGSSGAVSAGRQVDRNPVTVLLLGTDTRPQNPSLNTDVIMIASFNPDRQSATVVSVPRDTLIKVSGYSQLKANAYYAAFHHANKATADKKTKELFGKYLNVPIDYVARLDFNGFERIVDNLGGLKLEVDMNMCYTDKADGTSIRLTEGTHLLNGSQTLDFVRYRKGNCQNAADSNDIKRNERQQQVIDQMIGKLKSVEGVLKLGSVIEAAGDSVDTDMPASEIKSFIRTYMAADRDKINYVHLEGEWQSPYIIVRPDELKRAQTALREQLK
ncbi:LCP family protein [Paenibacillus sp. GYB003]|uniref:LCP family protein n=1 Tax=Paenibacillus sp. GYB003 TaxID=2994392 RepID=UPI002F96A226